MKSLPTTTTLLTAFTLLLGQTSADERLHLNEQEYLEMPGLNVMLAHDYYPEGHQGGVSIIQNGRRVATNGDLRLDRTPGQWQPVPTMIGERQIDPESQSISARFQYPDPEKNRNGFNPVVYPDLEFAYTLTVHPEGNSVIVTVDLDQALPKEWQEKVAFMIEFFPGNLFGKAYYMDEQMGLFPRQANGPGRLEENGGYHIDALATGKTLVVAPEDDELRLKIESLVGEDIELVDGRGPHTNGWFLARSLLKSDADKKALVWKITPNALPDWKSKPVIQVSQVGYHQNQEKYAIIELDKLDEKRHPVDLLRIETNGSETLAKSSEVEDWGRFLRYDYLHFDFSDIIEPGLYRIRYGELKTHAFTISDTVYNRHVWQPTLEYFLPVQMCHVRVNDRYRVWHDVCHLDDARMAPVDHNHFDGYIQGPDTMTNYAPGSPILGLNHGGWHDAGDDDLRVESQSRTIYGLTLAWEEFRPTYDNTTIDQENRVVEILRPDGKPDILQQIEHGTLTVLGGYQALGRFYRGIITPTKRQYVLVGDPSAQTDNQVFNPSDKTVNEPSIGTGVKGSPDDRWVFTEQHPVHEGLGILGLSSASRALREYNDKLASEALAAAIDAWTKLPDEYGAVKAAAAADLLLSTSDPQYEQFIDKHTEGLGEYFDKVGWVIVRALPKLSNPATIKAITDIAEEYSQQVEKESKQTPYGVPYTPEIWGAGWKIQRFGAMQYFLHKAYPDLYSEELIFRALNFILGCHPGSNSASFVSGVGSDSLTVGYGFNRADWSYIPGGSASGTALIRPDFPELLKWPFLWQQTEYVLGNGTTDYLLLALAAEKLLD